ncbi:hypothetical protein EW026_g1632 [Hermanssonia centrifuga]|uniref:DUF155 domain-containing protein n=1 Tax=Hermanssonia centrifuga TaxID=98765 RepID=A0A4S4KRJ7_9APHY|nr:hypothetical protein EW026_g1632 [Hermanssonia centrifuga]
MSKEQRQKAGFKRITAYCVAEGFKMKLLASFLKREHNVQPRVFDEAMYVMYHKPLLPGYGPGSNIRSSAAPLVPTPSTEDPIVQASDAEEVEATYFPAPSHNPGMDDFIASTSPPQGGFSESETTRHIPVTPSASFAVPRRSSPLEPDSFAEAVFLAYGVVVFFGLDESQERSILEDVEAAGVMQKALKEDRWEIEECHYDYNPYIAYPRIYNDFFTFKAHSALLTISVSHALAQSTLLARYETHANAILSSPETTSIPIRLASTGSLNLSRTDALKITGRLFKLRRDVNLVSNVLDVPDLFWEEGQASLRALYDAVREYMEISVRLGAIHDHLNNNAMERITWIIIWEK